MKGLIFSQPMMIAWLENRKTVTRRLVNKIPADWSYSHKGLNNEFCFVFKDTKSEGLLDSMWIKPRYLPGETVYIKETWAVDKKYDHLAPSKIPVEGRRPVYYKALYDDEYANVEKPLNVGRWRSPRFMPEWASRSHALIKRVRPEMVQKITEEEANKEGFGLSEDKDDCSCPVMPEDFSCDYRSRLRSFILCWQTLHPGSWERNDYVFRYELEKVD